jgi:hypothetical protein
VSTCNRFNLQTLGSQPIMHKNLPNHWLIGELIFGRAILEGRFHGRVRCKGSIINSPQIAANRSLCSWTVDPYKHQVSTSDCEMQPGWACRANDWAAKSIQMVFHLPAVMVDPHSSHLFLSVKDSVQQASSIQHQSQGNCKIWISKVPVFKLSHLQYIDPFLSDFTRHLLVMKIRCVFWFHPTSFWIVRVLDIGNYQDAALIFATVIQTWFKRTNKGQD